MFRVPSAVLCDRKNQPEGQEKDLCKAVVRPAMMHVDVAEMGMLRWMCDIRKMDRIRNERMIGAMEVGYMFNELPNNELHRLLKT